MLLGFRQTRAQKTWVFVQWFWATWASWFWRLVWKKSWRSVGQDGAGWAHKPVIWSCRNYIVTIDITIDKLDGSWCITHILYIILEYVKLGECRWFFEELFYVIGKIQPPGLSISSLFLCWSRLANAGKYSESQVHRNRMGPSSFVCWFITPSKSSYKYHTRWSL